MSCIYGWCNHWETFLQYCISPLGYLVGTKWRKRKWNFAKCFLCENGFIFMFKSTFTRETLMVVTGVATLILYAVKLECSHMNTESVWRCLIGGGVSCLALRGTRVARHWQDILINLPIHMLDTSCVDTRKSALCFLRFF